MKHSFIKLLLTAGIFAISCGKEPKFKSGIPFIKMEVNNKTWLPDSIFPLGYYSDDYELKDTSSQVSLIASQYHYVEGDAYATEILEVYLVTKKAGKQTIFGETSSKIYFNDRHPTPTTPVYGLFYTLQEQGEFICEDFIVDSTKANDNWIEITHQEGNYKKIWGKFNINLIRTGIKNGCTDVKYSDITKISNGEFYLEL